LVVVAGEPHTAADANCWCIEWLSLTARTRSRWHEFADAPVIPLFTRSLSIADAVQFLTDAGCSLFGLSPNTIHDSSGAVVDLDILAVREPVI